MKENFEIYRFKRKPAETDILKEQYKEFLTGFPKSNKNNDAVIEAIGCLQEIGLLPNPHNLTLLKSKVLKDTDIFIAIEHLKNAIFSRKKHLFSIMQISQEFLSDEPNKEEVLNLLKETMLEDPLRKVSQMCFDFLCSCSDPYNFALVIEGLEESNLVQLDNLRLLDDNLRLVEDDNIQYIAGLVSALERLTSNKVLNQRTYELLFINVREADLISRVIIALHQRKLPFDHETLAFLILNIKDPSTPLKGAHPKQEQLEPILKRFKVPPRVTEGRVNLSQVNMVELLFGVGATKREKSAPDDGVKNNLSL